MSNISQKDITEMDNFLARIEANEMSYDEMLKAADHIVGKHIAGEPKPRGQTKYNTGVSIEGKVYSREATIMGIERAVDRFGIGRNSKCICGSDSKWKHCCLKVLHNKNTDLAEFLQTLPFKVAK